jgi:adenylosuccinate lyase
MVADEPAIGKLLSKQELAECFDYEKHLKRIEVAYQRLGI